VTEPIATPALDEEPRTWLRWAAFAGAILLWLAASAPVSATGAGRAVGGLLIAVLVRAIYRLAAGRWRPDRPFIVPSLFVLAAFFCASALLGQMARDTDAAKQNAVNQGIVQNADDATPVDSCVAGSMNEFNSRPVDQRQGFTPDQYRTFSERVCAVADQRGYVLPNGRIYPEDQKKLVPDAKRIIQEMAANGELG
jgi:hypothetical protein